MQIPRLLAFIDTQNPPLTDAVSIVNSEVWSSCPESQYNDIEVALTSFIGVCSAWKQKRPRSPSGTNGRRVRRNSYKRRGVEISQQYLVVNGTGQRLKINYWCCSSSRPGVSSTSAACMVGLVNSMSITVIVITVNYSELQGGEICDLCCRLGPFVASHHPK